jgi:hypothetical protein
MKGIPRFIRENIIKVDVGAICCESAEWIKLTHDWKSGGLSDHGNECFGYTEAKYLLTT